MEFKVHDVVQVEGVREPHTFEVQSVTPDGWATVLRDCVMLSVSQDRLSHASANWAKPSDLHLDHVTLLEVAVAAGERIAKNPHLLKYKCEFWPRDRMIAEIEAAVSDFQNQHRGSVDYWRQDDNDFWIELDRFLTERWAS